MIQHRAVASEPAATLGWTVVLIVVGDIDAARRASACTPDEDWKEG